MKLATTYGAILGMVLENLREDAGVTQAQMAERVGIAASTWSRVENGRQTASIDQVALAAAELGVSPGDIVGRADAVRAEIARVAHVEIGRMDAASAVESGLALVDRATLRELARMSKGREKRR